MGLDLMYCTYFEIILNVINAEGRWGPCWWPMWDSTPSARLQRNSSWWEAAILVFIYCCFCICATVEALACRVQWNMAKHLAKRYILRVFSGNKSIMVNTLLVLSVIVRKSTTLYSASLAKMCDCRAFYDQLSLESVRLDFPSRINSSFSQLDFSLFWTQHI